jgi:hypothetical protein
LPAHNDLGKFTRRVSPSGGPLAPIFSIGAVASRRYGQLHFAAALSAVPHLLAASNGASTFLPRRSRGHLAKPVSTSPIQRASAVLPLAAAHRDERFTISLFAMYDQCDEYSEFCGALNNSAWKSITSILQRGHNLPYPDNRRNDPCSQWGNKKREDEYNCHLLVHLLFDFQRLHILDRHPKDYSAYRCSCVREKVNQIIGN